MYTSFLYGWCALYEKLQLYCVIVVDLSVGQTNICRMFQLILYSFPILGVHFSIDWLVRCLQNTGAGFLGMSDLRDSVG